MLKELDNCDWTEVFGEGTGGNCTAITPHPAPGYTGSIATFSREDVKRIIGMSEGERDERDWVIYGVLKDGRYFVARGGCDYTGWDCRASNSGDVAGSKANIIRYGLTQNERSRFALPEPKGMSREDKYNHVSWDEYDYYDFPEDNEDGLFDPMEKEDMP